MYRRSSNYNSVKIGLTLLTLAVSLASCNRDIDEFKFKATVITGGYCSASQVYYYIDILTPDSLGSRLTNNGMTYSHAVIAYKASRMLHEGDTIYGVGYLTESYAALNCNMVPDTKLQEMILLSVDEKPF